MTWTKLPILTKHPHSGCLNCGPKPIRVKLNANLHPGFGEVSITLDGERVEVYFDGDKCPTFRRFENLARKDPDHDWRVFINAPLYDVTYQRHGHNEWVAVGEGIGFA
jgi:hypothetical protein